MTKTFKLSMIIFLICFIVSLITLPHYGINWDTTNHLPRGQTYLHFFLTGKKDFSDLPPWKNYYQNPQSLGIDADIEKKEVPKRSLYQDPNTTFDWYIANDGDGHPPLSDILSSVFNLVLFQKLGIINDIDSYRVYGVLLSSLLIALAFYWTSQIYSKFAGLISALSLYTYPLFFSELHFNNEKDIPETVYWSFLVFSVWKGITTKNWKWILVSGVFFGLALGTKFNVLFIPFVIVPWLVILNFNFFKKKNIAAFVKNDRKFIAAILFAPILGIIIFIASWPYLWYSGLDGIKNVLGFYHTIGATTRTDSRFIWYFGINLYPIKWIIYTTPPIVLGIFFAGFGFFAREIFKRKDKIGLLFLLWFFIPIIRVSLPNTNIYGGVRQIMEYIPALAILTGAGAFYIKDFLINRLNMRKNKLMYVLISILFVILFIPHLFKLKEIHPNENVYFNFLSGGLSKAQKTDLPGWGNTFGAAYREAFVWINNNAEKDSSVAFAYELAPNFPAIFIRRDLILDNHKRSGSAKWGEYVVTLTYQAFVDRSYYDNYLERFLEPVYQSSVDGVSVVKVWKNDAQHTRKGFLKEALLEGVKLTKEDKGLLIDLGATHYLSRVEVKFGTDNCQALSGAYSLISEDGANFKRVVGNMPDEDWNVEIYGKQPMKGSFIQPFAADKARYIRYIISPSDACLNDITSLKVYYLPDLDS